LQRGLIALGVTLIAVLAFDPLTEPSGARPGPSASTSLVPDASAGQSSPGDVARSSGEPSRPGATAGRTSGPTATATAKPTKATATPRPPPKPTSPAPTPAPTVGPGGASLHFPIRAAFYYPWFAEAWKQQGYNPFSWFKPTLGYYATTSVIKQHIAAMRRAHIQAGIASWWGQGSRTDQRIATLLAAAGSFRWSLYYEAEGSSDPSVAKIHSDLAYIAAHYVRNPAFLRVAGKPVIFVYGDGADRCAMADRWHAANTLGFYVVLKVFPGFKSCVHQPSSWHQYAPAVASDHQAGYSFSISPGFWKRTDATARLVRSPTRWTSDVAAMVASHEKWQLITTFNEWGEGTGVEDTVQYGSTFLDALAAR
jgi:Glycosyl hydrolase family 99